MADVIIIAIITIAFFFILRSLIRKFRNGQCSGSCAGCSGNCSGCMELKTEDFGRRKNERKEFKIR